jgi:signal transduction histidine kinase
MRDYFKRFCYSVSMKRQGWIALALVFPFFSCVQKGGTEYTLDGVIKAWHEVEASLNASLADPGDAGAPGPLGIAADRFDAELTILAHTRIFVDYTDRGYIAKDDIEVIRDNFLQFKQAPRRNLEKAALIRSMLMEWQNAEIGVMNETYRTLFSQYISFAVAAFILIAILIFMQRALQKVSQERQEGIDFSLNILNAQEKERGRIAAELHDTVLQDLSRIAGALEAGTDTGSKSQNKNIRAVIDAIRHMCVTFMPPDFSRLDFADVIAQLCGDFQKHSGIKCIAGIPAALDTGAFSSETRLHCFRLVQEALTNIEKHSGADEAVVSLRNYTNGDKTTLLIIVSDDGVGVKKLKPGTGIRGMYYRARLIGASLQFTEDEGEGLIVRIEIPTDRESPLNVPSQGGVSV